MLGGVANFVHEADFGVYQNIQVLSFLDHALGIVRIYTLVWLFQLVQKVEILLHFALLCLLGSLNNVLLRLEIIKDFGEINEP